VKRHNEKIICKDGFTMSVQANETAYCEPRIDDAERYTTVEVGFPSMPEALLMEWAENPKAPMDTVYGNVPSERISLVCAKHGGIVSGELPAGVAYVGVKK
jgi:hypothetical protein